MTMTRDLARDEEPVLHLADLLSPFSAAVHQTQEFRLRQCQPFRGCFGATFPSRRPPQAFSLWAKPALDSPEAELNARAAATDGPAAPDSIDGQLFFGTTGMSRDYVQAGRFSLIRTGASPPEPPEPPAPS